MAEKKAKPMPKNGRRKKSTHDPQAKMDAAGWHIWPLYTLLIIADGKTLKLAVTKASSGFDLWIEDEKTSSHTTLDEVLAAAESYRKEKNGRIVRNTAMCSMAKGVTGLPVEP